MLALWRRTRPWVRVVAVVLLVGVAGTGVYWFGIRETPAQAATPESTTTAVAASLSTIQQSVSASGTLTPTVQEDVSFAVSGTVTSVDVAAGDTVTAGQQLATVDTLQLNAALLQARADLASARASLSNAQDEADGSDSSDAQVAALSAQVDVAQTAVDDAEADLAGATLTAPVSGLLTTVDVEVGDVVTGSGSSSGSGSTGGTGSSGTAGGMTGSTGSTGSSTTSSSTAPFVVVGTDAWQISVSVSESDVDLLAVGNQAEITTSSSTDTVYGTVSEIGLLPSSSGGVAAYPVTIDVTGSPEGLHDGESADVSIIYERRTDVLTVPASAVTTDEDGQTVVTQEGADGATVSTAVTVGETSGTMIEITEGLAEGDEVLVTTFSPRTSGSGDGSGDTEQGQFPGGGEMPDLSSGERPDFSQLPGGGQMPGGGNG
ncbi:efflux RND transporter periplasmic adaptor subunit [Cellulomonas pakistanensis]|uniref:Hemolysin D n=1 Tax=Cellulomonas pakistanensis TaxID=992287 RepID=A0A919P7V8_9CELL|nr:biotin/lipoyl-binding protein [Cellulomonas pakistanensis]GIG35984.1 hemolysin D [Cellulomonas pakistanensis]